MKLAEATWQEVDALDRDTVVVIPTGSLEQHGPHLPLLTDTIIATAVAEAVEARLPSKALLTPTLWLGASQHHLAFAGSLSASFRGYHESLVAVVESLIRHRFHRFYVINGHGGNTEPNGVAMRELKLRYPNATFGHCGYFTPIADQVAEVLEGSIKEMRHACEAETSLMLHLRPDLVRVGKLRDDGLSCEPAVHGLVYGFEVFTEQGSLGEATKATAEKGRLIFEAAVEAMTEQVGWLAEGVRFVGGS